MIDQGKTIFQRAFEANPLAWLLGAALCYAGWSAVKYSPIPNTATSYSDAASQSFRAFERRTHERVP